VIANGKPGILYGRGYNVGMKMKTSILLIMGLFPILVLAMGPEYRSSVKTVKEHSPTNSATIEKPLYIANVPNDPPPKFAFILSCTNGVTLRTVLDQTLYRGKPVFVMILRKKKPSTLVFDNLVKEDEKPDFSLMSGDMIWLARGDGPMVR